ncbi:hypothetical protein CVT24_009600 [Panaeolus cyanescens]|uniref:Uncharacterized protein n=1 Tax=Panaeolus cyanescens TaxID=181874 RepID=A0A409WEV7_9AGAR|nr:hypothetical protein CVT24_009600 [Panaeolus cyanescens]
MNFSVEKKVVCPGCRKPFTLKGLTLHQSQTLRLKCRAIWRQKLQIERNAQNNVAPPVPQNILRSPEPPSLPSPRAHSHVPSDTETLPNLDESFSESEEHTDEEIDEDAHDDDGAGFRAEDERDWEPVREGAPAAHVAEDGEDGTQNPEHDQEIPIRNRFLVGDGLGVKPRKIVKYSVEHPQSLAGRPLTQEEALDNRYHAALAGSTTSEDKRWAPFTSKTDWDVAYWAKRRGPGSTAFTDLLALEGVQEKLGLSYRTSDELNKIIDQKLPARPEFERHEVVMGGESITFYSRNVVDCLRSLWADPDFADDLLVEPEKQYADDESTIRVYHEMNTADWWWKTQKKVENETEKTNCTIIPIIISSDKTQLTDFRGINAYPVYMTIGNLPKHIRCKPSRQGQMLIAYLPTTKLTHIANKSSRRRAVSNLFHHCMHQILQPLESAGCDGIVLTSGDGLTRRCYPILAAYPGDYPEQTLVALVKNGQCPVCPADRNEIGEWDSKQSPRSTKNVIRALRKSRKGAREFTKACKEHGVKPVQSVFWKDLPHVDIYRAITPDLLHQLYQGVFKHLISWIREACGDAEIDARCRRLPPNHHIRLFMKGITNLSRVTGTEHDQISRFLLALVADIRLPNGVSNSRLVKCTRALLDFMAIARYPIHTCTTLDELEDALKTFHECKSIFLDLGVRENFNIPKIHFMCHYREFIEYLGSPDNFNTEYTERLHIDYAKDAYAATNRKDEFPQMTRWLNRLEKMNQHEKFIRRRVELDDNSPLQIDKPLPSLIPRRRLHMARHPTGRGRTLEELASTYGASQFSEVLKRFIVKLRNPDLNRAAVDAAAVNLHLHFQKVSVYHRIKFVSHDVYALKPMDEVVVDAIHVDPAHRDKYGMDVPGRFDTALIRVKESAEETGLHASDFGVAQIRCVFTLPAAAERAYFPNGFPYRHLAYVEWFTPMS